MAGIGKAEYYVSDLRKIMREQRAKLGLTQAKTGRAINVSGSQIAAIENGRLIPQPPTAARLDALFGTGNEIQKAAEAARNDAQPLWLRPWTEQEAKATLLRAWEPSLIPGLLQTEAYTLAVLRGSRLPKQAVERTAQVRKDRQAATLGRADPPMLSAIIGEAALMCGPTDVLKEQLEHVLRMTELPHVQVLVVPWSAGLHAGLSGAFVIATLPNRHRVAYVDDQLRGRVVAGPEVERLELAWEIVSGLALPVHLSRDLIKKAVDQL